MATIDHHALLYRIDVRAWLCAVALGGFLLGSANAAKAPDFGHQPINYGGKTTTFGPMGNSGGSTVPVSPSIGGWTQAGNYGFPAGATGPTIGHVVNGEFVVGGSAGGGKYPFQATSPVSLNDIAKGVLTMGCSFITGGAAALACTVATPFVYDWIKKAGGRVNPTTGQLEHADTSGGYCSVAPCWEYGFNVYFFPSLETACQQWVSQRQASDPSVTYSYTGVEGGGGGSNGTCKFHYTYPGQSQDGTTQMAARARAPDTGEPPWQPYTTNDAFREALSNTAPDGRVVGEILSKGGDIPMGAPTITGPTTIVGPTTVTVNNDGSRTTTTTTNNYTTNNNAVTNTGQTSTKTVTNADGTTRSTETTTTTPTDTEDAKPKDPCDANPQRIGCQDIDVPEGTIPRENKTITFSPEDSFGGGSCPADRYWSSSLMPGTYKVVDWSTFCANAVAVRALVLLLATFAAFLIVMPGKEVRT